MFSSIVKSIHGHKGVGIRFFSSVLSVVGVGLLTAPTAGALAYTQSSGTVVKTGQAYSTTTADESAVYVSGTGVFTLSNSTIDKSGDTSSSDNSSFYGLNAGVLAYTGGTITLNSCTVDTTGKGANGVFAYGTGKITMTGGTVTCTAQYAHAVMASGGGTLSATDVDMSTEGANSGAIATDRGNGTITVDGGTIITTGQDSPGIYSTGTITVSDATISASNSEGAVIEGLNNVTLTNVSLSGGANDYGGVLIVQTMSGDSETGTAKFTMTGGSLSASSGALFFVTNTDTNITLSGVSTSVSSGTLISAEGTTRWGTSGSNGGNVEFTANGQTLTGNIVVDDISSFTGSLTNGSTLTGAIDAANTASSLSLTLDATSSWTVTANSHVGVFSDSAGISGTSVSNVTGNGYYVYYDSSLSGNSALGAKTYSLAGGGYLLPEGTSVEEVTLTVAKSGNGSVSPTVGTHTYTKDEVVTLTATADSGWSFDHWSGDLSGSTNPTTITMSGDKSVTAVFTEDVAKVTLTVEVSGDGAVTPEAGDHEYSSGTAVTLTAKPGFGSTFVGWQGDIESTDNPLELTLTEDLVVTATFERVDGLPVASPAALCLLFTCIAFAFGKRS